MTTTTTTSASSSSSVHDCCFFASDLVEGAPDALVIVDYCGYVSVEGGACGWTLCQSRAHCVGDLKRVLTRHYFGVKLLDHDWPAPSLSAKKIADRWRKREPFTPEQLLAIPHFAKAARKAAEAGKSYTSDLLEYEQKSTVVAAVAIVKGQVEIEWAEKAAVQARLQAEADAKTERERPTVEAVTEAYDHCNYRVCSQGHNLRVVISSAGKVGLKSDVLAGDRYSSQCSYRRQTSLHVLTVRADWLSVVAANGVQVVGGQLTLDAEIIGHTKDGKEAVIRLTQVRQGRGTSLELDTVYYVSSPDGLKLDRLAKDNETFAYRHPDILHDVLIDLGREDLSARVRLN